MGSHILLKGSQMFPLWTLGFAWLIFGFTTACEPAVGTNAASRNACYQKDCNGTQYDIQEATCCENKLHPGASLSCCGKEPFNPETATCCKVQHTDTLTASVTQGLSEKVSKCCELKAFNPVNEICCQSTITAKPAPMAECCGKEAFDKDKQLCCGPTDNKVILIRNSIHHRCCGHNQYDRENQCCCGSNVLEIQPKNSSCCVKDSAAPAGGHDMEKLHCGPDGNKTVLVKKSSHHQCCGHSQFDNKTQCCCTNKENTLEIQPKNSACCVEDSAAHAGGHDMEKLHCGPDGNKTVLVKKSSHHQCCGHSQFDNKTQCCCTNKENTLEIQPKNSACCDKDSAAPAGVKQQILELQHNCREPNTHLCGSSCYDRKKHRCCERNQTPHWSRASDQSKTTATVFDPHTQICCDGRVSAWKPWIDQCCGETPYGLAQRGVLCCNNTLYKDREDGEECSETGIPYNLAKGTMCCSQFHGSPGQHCCGTELYRPRAEICCNGHRHLKSENIHCCGVKAYNIKDPQMKCCAGTLYNLMSLEKHGGNAQCCGSILQKPQDICCSSEDKEVLYSVKRGFSCCGHLYYNTTLWSCCAGRLRSIHEQGQDQTKMIYESRLQSVNNLNITDLCTEMHIGTVESVSLHSIVFRGVLKVCGQEAKVNALPLPYILYTNDHCSSPKVIPGKTYFFNEVNVFTDFNHDSVLQSLYFIMSKCSP